MESNAQSGVKHIWTEEEMEKVEIEAERYHQEEMKEIDRIYEAELAAEKKAEDKWFKSIAEDMEIDRMIEHMEMLEHHEQDQRILAEITDRKEEDGGEYYPRLYP